MKKDIFKMSPPEFVEALFTGVRSGDIDQEQFIGVIERFAHDNYVSGVHRGKEQIENHAMLIGKSASLAEAAKYLGIPVEEILMPPQRLATACPDHNMFKSKTAGLIAAAKSLGIPVVESSVSQTTLFADEFVPENRSDRALTRKIFARAIASPEFVPVPKSEMACWTEE